MLEYLLKVSFVVGIALLFYKSVLQQESFFATNRLYLIGCIVLAFALPLIALPQLVSQQGFLAAVLQPAIQPEAAPVGSAADATPPQAMEAHMPASVPSEPPISQNNIKERAEVHTIQPASMQTNWLFWLAMCYGFGVVIFSLNLLAQAATILYKAISSTDKVQDGECMIINTEHNQAPCSFFHYIFIYPDAYDFATYEQIVAHEKTHVRMGHTYDLLIAELAVIILWFNPLMWYYKKEIEKNMEYQTDAILLEKEQINKDQYQLSLLQIACPHKSLSITINYNQSLLKQRIIMMNAKKSNLHSYWKYTFLAPLFFGTLLFLNEPAISQDKAQNDPATVPAPTPALAPMPTPAPVPANPPSPEAVPGIAPVQVENEVNAVIEREVVSVMERSGYSINSNGQRVDMSKGYWYSNQENGEYCLQLRGNKNTSSWNMFRCFDKGLFQKKGKDTFVMSKETGTLELTGNLDEAVGQGTYTFTADASFKNFLADNNITSNDPNLLFHLFFGDVSREYVSFLKKQYNNVTGDRLLELAIHGITMNDFQYYVALFQKHSNKQPEIREVVEAKIHDIDQKYVQEMEAMGFGNLPLKKMMEAKIHGVNRAYVEGLRNAGFENLQIDKVIGAKIHGVSAANIKEMQGLGFGDLSLDKMMELRIHQVNAAYISDLKAAGLDKLSINQIVEANIHGLNSETIKEIRSLGFKDLDFREMVSARIHGVSAAYIEELQKAGIQHLTLSKIVEAKIHGIDGNFIRKAKQDGYDLNSVDEYVRLKIHGMALESLKKN